MHGLDHYELGLFTSNGISRMSQSINQSSSKNKEHFTNLLNAAEYSRSLAFKISRACFIDNVCIDVQIGLVDLSDDNQRTTLPM